VPFPHFLLLPKPELMFFVDDCCSYALSTHLAFMALMARFQACFMLQHHHPLSKQCFAENCQRLVLEPCSFVL
jgi:hypothetical protein